MTAAGTVLITGAARRLGAAMARALAADGWQVIISYNRSAAEAEALVAEIEAAGGRCHAVAADLADRATVARLIPDCVTRFGRIDCLINNASSFRAEDIGTMSFDSYDFHMRPNLEAPLFLAQGFVRALGDAPGVIINMLDQKIANLNPDFLSYTVAKAGLAAATRMLAMAFGGRIRVCGIGPGVTLISGKQTPQGFERAWRSPPLGRSSTPDEMVAAVRFILATPSLNGQVLFLDGGESLRGRARDVAFEV
ncbi:MAG TPA: SDR family oxidoreductase [Acetobacteraceae bacterium]|nr:SDR family oxidoreductase [Acetobacteraceae bacterium]